MLYFLQNKYLLFFHKETETQIEYYAQYIDTLGNAISQMVLLEKEKILEGFLEKTYPTITAFYDKKASNIKVYTDIANKGKASEKIKLKIFHLDLKLKTEKTLDFAIMDILYTQYRIFFDSNDIFYVIAKKYPDKKSWRRDIGQIVIFSYDINKNISNENVINMFDKNIKILSQTTYDDTIKFLGTYCNSNKGITDGVFSFNYYKTEQMLSITKISPFNRTITGKLYDPSKAAVPLIMPKDKTQLNQISGLYLFNESLHLKNGDRYLIFENLGFGFFADFLLNDIFIIKINSQGDIVWSSMLPKKQLLYQHPLAISNKNAKRTYSMTSATPFISNNELNLVYNDTRKNISNSLIPQLEDINLNIKEENSPLVCMVAHFDKDGEMTKEELFSSIDEKVSAYIENARQLSENKWLFFASNKKARTRKIGILEW